MGEGCGAEGGLWGVGRIIRAREERLILGHRRLPASTTVVILEEVTPECWNYYLRLMIISQINY